MKRLLPVAALVFLSAVLCVIGLGRPALWIDEIHSYEFAALPSVWLVVLNAAARDAYPPLYFLLLHWWLEAGSGETWMRMLSVLCHLASIPFMYMIGSRIMSRHAGIAAAALLAISPFHVAFAREVRMYSPLALLALVSIWGLVVHFRDRSRWSFRVFTFAGLALILTHFMGALVIVVQGAWLLVELKKKHRRVLLRWAAVLVAGFLPWSPFFLKAFLVTRGFASEASPHLLLYWFVSAIGAGFAAAPWVLAAGFVIVAVCAGAGFAAMPAGPWRRLLGIWAFAPVGLELAANLMGKPVFGARTLITCTPAWLLLAAQAMAAPPRLRGAVAAALLAGLAAVSFHDLFSGMSSAPAHGDAVAYVRSHARSGDVILHSTTVTYHAAREYYGPRSAASGAAGIEDMLIEPRSEFEAGKLGRMFRRVWRDIRARADPEGVLRTGADPNRIPESEFLSRGFTRIWYFHTTESGKRRIWRLIPGRYYAPTEDEMRTVPFARHARLKRAYGHVRTWKYPGLRVELHRRIE